MGKAVFDYYLGKSIKIGQHINSPFRHDSNSGSFNLYINQANGLVYFKDHVEDKFGDAVDFIRYKYLLDFAEARERIKVDLGTVDKYAEGYEYLHLPRQRTFETSNVIITYEKKEWSKEDQLFWMRFNVSFQLLERYRVCAASSVTIQRSDYTYTMKSSIFDPIYIIIFPSGRYKVYRPLTSNKKNKWRSTIRIEDVFGLDLLADDLPCVFICGGNKDTLAMASLIEHDMAITNSSETVMLSPYTYTVLKNKCKQIYLVYDADKTGRERTQRIIKEYPDIIDASFPIVATSSKFTKVKDLSDVIEMYRQVPYAIQRLKSYYTDLINSHIDHYSMKTLYL